MKKNSYAIIILFFICIAVAGFLYRRYKVPPSINLPVIALTDLSGHPVSLSSFAGHPLFISFFATWCGPCMRELPELADLHSALADRHLQVVCICDEPIGKLRDIQARFGDCLIVLHSERSFHDIGIYTYPTNYICNASGMKVYQKVNPEDWEDPEVVARIGKLIR
jgi:peroxiredoxin